MASASASTTKNISVGGYTIPIYFEATFSTSGGITVTATNNGVWFTYAYSCSWSASNGASGSFKPTSSTSDHWTAGQTRTLFSSGPGFGYGSVSVSFDFCGISVSLSAYIDEPEPSRSNGSIRVGKSTININEKQSITLSNGTNNSITGLSWSFNGRSGSLSASSQQWDLMDIEPYTINGTQFTVTLTATQSYLGSISTSFVVVIPDSFKPSIKKGYIERINTSNNNLIAGQSQIKVNVSKEMLPDGNSASISSISVSGKYNPEGVGSFSYSISSDSSNIVIVSGIFPNYAAKPKYQLTLTITATDTRGRSSSVEFNVNDFGYIYCYIPPQITLNNLYRCDSSGNLQISGQYAYIELEIISDSTVKTSGAISINGVSYDLINAGSNIYKAVVGNGLLLIGNQYPLSISIINQTMINYGDTAIVLNQLLPTMSMPISLYDDGALMGVSFGEMATKYNDVYGTFVNFAKGCVGRVTDDAGNTIVKSMFDVFDQKKCPFPVGSIFFNMDGTNPNRYDGWSDTSWQIVGEGKFIASVGTGSDKNGTQFTVEVGDDSTAGEYSHTLTVQEMPSHSHTVEVINKSTEEVQRHDGVSKSKSVQENAYRYVESSSVGSNQAHNNIPPYFGLYVWERTA